MIHPATELRIVNETIGYGVFATTLIPKGAIVYVKDPLEIELSPARYNALDPAFRILADKYSYIDEKGSHIISWDIAKYVNHSCRPNTMSAGYGFEIAIEDIAPGQELTDEYGLFNLMAPMTCFCQSPSCRGCVSSEDIDIYAAFWDECVRDALSCVASVAQPLVQYLDTETYTHLLRYINGKGAYRSVTCLKAHRPTPVSIATVSSVAMIPEMAGKTRARRRRN
ncbi:MAG: SET domain-containing protein [Sedimentisphaerales bacterium]|nr:SET domain-containing protein [Sedimentisphaerales bacterium]